MTEIYNVYDICSKKYLYFVALRVVYGADKNKTHSLIEKNYK